MAKINWTLVRRDYISGRLKKDGKLKHFSAKDLSEKYGCSQSAVQKKCLEEEWPKKRKEYWQNVESDVLAKKQQDQVEKVNQFDQDIFSLACFAVEILKDKISTQKTVGYGASGDAFEETVADLNIATLEVRRVMEASKMAQDVRTNAMGDIAESQAEKSLNKLTVLMREERRKGEVS